LLDHGQDALGVAGQTAARVGQLGPAGGPVKQGGAGLSLERGELLRHGGRRVAEDGGCPGDAAAGRELLEQAEPVQIEHKRILLSAIEIGVCAYGYFRRNCNRCTALSQQVRSCPFLLDHVMTVSLADPAARKCSPQWLSPSRR